MENNKEDCYSDMIEEKNRLIKKEEERIASYITLSNAKDIELIKAKRRIKQLEERIDVYERSFWILLRLGRALKKIKRSVIREK